jgi:hypothetical protein
MNRPAIRHVVIPAATQSSGQGWLIKLAAPVARVVETRAMLLIFAGACPEMLAGLACPRQISRPHARNFNDRHYMAHVGLALSIVDFAVRNVPLAKDEIFPEGMRCRELWEYLFGHDVTDHVPLRTLKLETDLALLPFPVALWQAADTVNPLLHIRLSGLVCAPANCVHLFGVLADADVAAAIPRLSVNGDNHGAHIATAAGFQPIHKRQRGCGAWRAVVGPVELRRSVQPEFGSARGIGEFEPDLVLCGVCNLAQLSSPIDLPPNVGMFLHGYALSLKLPSIHIRESLLHEDEDSVELRGR